MFSLHSRADAIASTGVLFGLVLVKYFTQVDCAVAILIGLYIGFEAFGLGKEITDSLLDVSNKDLEEKIKNLCGKLNINLSSIKSRKIGGANFAELKIDLDPRLKVDEATSITKNLEEKLLNTISELKYVVISVESHEMKRGIIIPQFGERMRFKGGFQPIELKKLGERAIIPVEACGKDKYEISGHFGVLKYMVVEEDKDGKIQRKEIVKNPYWSEEAGHGFKFARAISADKVIARHIGQNAQQNMKAYGIEFKIIEKDKKLEEIV
jgi:predicted Fe-Mo cluster-binding NifX family protein